jgi:hypothetical protein
MAVTMTEHIPYAEIDTQKGWTARYRVNGAIRMIAFAIMALAGAGWRYLTHAVVGNQDLPDVGKYMLMFSCVGFVFEYLISLIGSIWG